MKNISVIIGFLLAMSSVQAMQNEYDELELFPEIRSFLCEAQPQGLLTDDSIYSIEQVHTEKEGQGNDATELSSQVTLSAAPKGMSLDEDIRRAYDANPKKCPECKYRGGDSRETRRHAARMHNRCLECENCKKFDDRATIERHYKQHHPKTDFAKVMSRITCELCNKSFIYGSYNGHVRKVHFKNDNVGYKAFLKDESRKRRRIEESEVAQTATTSTQIPAILVQARNILASQTVTLSRTANQSAQ